MSTLGTKPILVICEGPSDCGLINALIRHHGFGKIHCLCPGERNIGPSGFAAIPQLLGALQTDSRWPDLAGLFLVVDANGDPAGRALEAVKIFQQIDLPIPATFTLHSEGSPSRAAYLVPGQGKTGCLEDLLLDAIQNAAPQLISCVDSFAECVTYPSLWPANDRAKMRVHALMAACCVEEPATALSRVWNREGNPIPIGSPIFDDLVSWLRRFENLVSSQVAPISN